MNLSNLISVIYIIKSTGFSPKIKKKYSIMLSMPFFKLYIHCYPDMHQSPTPTLHHPSGNFILYLFKLSSSFSPFSLPLFVFYSSLKKKKAFLSDTHLSFIATSTLILKFLISPYFVLLSSFLISIKGTYIYPIAQAKYLRIIPKTLFQITSIIQSTF